MGAYTEFHFNAELRKDIPIKVLNTLRFMLDNETPSIGDLDEKNIPLFQTANWSFMLTSDSIYFDGETKSLLVEDEDDKDVLYLNIKCNLKNYDGEIEKFCAWIDPYLAKRKNDFLGFYRKDNQREPDLIYKL